MEDGDQKFVVLTTDIVSAYVSNNSVPVTEVPVLLQSVHAAIARLGNGQGSEGSAADEPRPAPAVSIKKSISPDFLICLEDGKQFKSLRRHLMSTYKMTPDDYRRRWGLPSDYPMTAPNYSQKRSELAKQVGLGQQRRNTAQKSDAPKAAKIRRKAAA